MADKRMFSKTIIDSDLFLDMSLSAQALYFHLSLRADDEGFINNPKKIIRMIGARDDDFTILIAKQFLIPFESGVVVIKHWRIHNYIRGDRLRETFCKLEKEQLSITDNVYFLPENGENCLTYDGQLPDMCHTQDRLGKVRLGEDSIDMSSEKEKSDKNSKEKDLCDSVESRQRLDYDNIKSLFNKICKVMPNIKDLTEKRKKVLKTLVKSQPDFNFEEYFKKVADTPFLNGHNKNGWVAGFDWIMKPDNITKVIEDTYKSNQNQQQKQQGKPIQATNYEQREYDDEFFDSLIVNKEYI